jgi:hypothetical protein
MENQLVVTYDDRGMVVPNYDNMTNIISHIEANGIDLFNMSTFIGFKNAAYTDFYQAANEINPHNNPSEDYIKTTAMFNCDTVGCIAGFAVACMNDWKKPWWFDGSVKGTNIQKFELEACKYMGIPISVGRKIFYGERDSIWAYLYLYESENYPMLSIDCEDEPGELRHCYEFGDDIDINLHSIHYKYAVDVLIRIRDGKIVFDSSCDFKVKY